MQNESKWEIQLPYVNRFEFNNISTFQCFQLMPYSFFKAAEIVTINVVLIDHYIQRSWLQYFVLNRNY